MVDYDLGTARGTIALDASSLGRASTAFMGLGRGLLGFSAISIGAFALVAKSAADFEKQVSALGAATNATEADMEAFRQKALELGSTTVFSAGEIVRAMEQLGKAGLSVEEILGGATEATINLAAAAGDELPGGVDRAAEIIANAMRTFGASVEEMDHFADSLVGAAISSTTSVEDLATSFRYAAPIAHDLGLSIDDLNTLLAILGDNGIRGSIAGTSLRGVLISLSGSSGPAREALRQLGIVTADGTNRFYELDGSLRPIPEVMQVLQDSLEGLSQRERTAALNAIFQRRAMNAASILARSGAEGFREYADAIAQIDAENIAARKLDNLSGDMTILKNSVDALIIRVGLEFQDMLRGWVQGLTGVVQWLNDLDPAILAVILKALAFAGVIAGVLGAMSLFIGLSIKMYRNFIVLKEAIILVWGAVKLLLSTLLLNPWFLLIAALVLLGVVLYDAYKNVDEFRALVDRAFAAVKDFVMPIIQGLIDGIKGLVEAFSSGVSESEGFVGIMERIGLAARAVADFFTGAFIDGIRAFFAALAGEGVTSDGFVGAMERIGVAVRGAAIWINDYIIPALVMLGKIVGAVALVVGVVLFQVAKFLITEVLPRIVWFVKETTERIVSGFQWLNENVFPIFIAFGELIVEIVKKVIAVIDALMPVFTFAFNTIMVVVTAFWTAFKFIFETFINVITTLWRNFGDNIWQAISLVFNAIKVVVETVLGVIRGIIMTITGLISGDWSQAWEGIKLIFGSIWEGIKAIPELALQFIMLLIENAFDVILSIFQIAWDTITNLLSTAWEIIKQLVLGGIQAIKDAISAGIAVIVAWFTALPGNIGSALGNLIGTLAGKGWDLLTGFLQGVIDKSVELIGWFLRLPERIIGWIGDLGNLLYNIGRDIIGGLIDGIQDMIPSLGDVVGGIGGFIGGLKGPPAYDKVLLTPHGQWIMQSLISGIKDQLPALRSLVSGIGPMIDTSMVATVGAGTTGVTTIAPVISINFPNVKSAQDMESIERALSDSYVLSELTKSIQAGVGRT